MGVQQTGRVVALIVTAGLPVAAMAQGDPLGQPFPDELHVDELDGGIGFTIDGLPTLSGLGASVSDAGDLNGDGVDDFIVARANDVDNGAMYVVFGAADGFPPVIDVADLTGDNGFPIDGFEPADLSGRTVARAGDVNGDGIDDIVIGAERADDFDGRASVLFGRTTGFPAVLALADLDGSDGFNLLGELGIGKGLGSAVAAAGDINGDGIDDLIVGSDRYYGGDLESGAADVIFGRTTGFAASARVDDLVNGRDGFRVFGVGRRQNLGRSVAPAGDVNGDGFDDVIIGSTDWQDDPYYGGARAGAAYVIYGRGTAFPPGISVSRLSGLGFEIRGETRYGSFGDAVSAAGDLNGDGIDDVLIGAPGEITPVGFAGAAYVIYGRAPSEPPFPELLSVDGLPPQSGVKFNGMAIGDQTGRSVATLGDINGDGRDDVAIVAWGVGSPYAGATYVLYGRADDFPGDVQLGTLESDSGFRIRGSGINDRFGWALSSAGDVNGDGVRDILVGAPFAEESGGASTGQAYVIYGRSASCPADLDGDGELTVFDFLEFQNLFDAGDDRADFDEDGRLTLFDFLAFQTAFDAGCD
ncbi:MAG: VCBS repeat-containing protein [Planctomycetota bacterium]